MSEDAAVCVCPALVKRRGHIVHGLSMVWTWERLRKHALD